MTTENRQVPMGRSVRTEPSWGRVLLTTVELWLSRRLGRRPARLLAVVVAVAAVIALAALQFAGVFSPAAPRAVAGTGPRTAAKAALPAAAGGVSGAAAAVQSAAAAWIASQVSSAAMIGCYPALCASLQAHGVSASRLVPLGPTMTGLLMTEVTATLPSADPRLVAQYAPGIIASFGSGGARIEVRAVAPGGAAAYQSALRADLAARQSAGSQLLKNSRIGFSPADAARIRAGQLDSRVLATLATLSSQFSIRVTALADSAPGVPPFFRGVAVASDGAGNSAAALATALAMVSAQQSPYQPALCEIVHPGAGRSVLLVEFAAPGPLGLLTPVLTADRSANR